MSDAWVENVQEWLNDTYTGVAGWNPVSVDGDTGWQTMHGLTRALQHELGITALADAVGPATMSALETIGNIGIATAHPNIENINRILSGVLYCKGYNAGNGVLNAEWTSAMSSAIEEVQTNLGIATTGVVSSKLFKSLLTLDAYIVVGSGTETVREVQQWMNSTYLNQSWFSIIPTDGSYSRDVQKAFVYAIQKELNVSGANGIYGPGTRAAVNSKPAISTGAHDTGTSHWVKLFQAALRFNNINAGFNGTFNATDSTLTSQFQQFCMLPETGTGNYKTWSSLLVSTGDPDRSGIAADCASQVTAARASALVSDGRQIIGRYLTNAPVTPMRPSPLNKKLQPGELNTIFTAGLKVFPIFQTTGDGVSYFSSTTGRLDCIAAVEAAAKYGFKRDATIYFAVDCDPTGAEIKSKIIPHFESINRTMQIDFDRIANHET